jgi:peptide/nickel transport system substrate-binding protein
MRCGRFYRARQRWRSVPSWAVLCLSIIIPGAAVAGCAGPPPQAHRLTTLRLGTRDAVDARVVLSRFLFAEHLITIDWRGRPQEALATGWEWKDEGHALEVRLRPGVTFHDGTPLTARVVADILTKVKGRDPRQSFAAVIGFEAKDAHTLLVRLTRPDAFLVEGIADTLIVDPQKPNVGTGPFKLLSLSPSVIAERNASYYRGAPGIDRVEVTAYDTPRAAWVALMRGQVDMVQQVNRDSAEFLEGVSHVEMSSTILPYYIPLVFNLRHPILRRVEVRRALAEAIDREEIVREGMRGHGRVADDPVWPFHWAYNAAARKHGYNPNASRVRLDAAGLPILPSRTPGRMASRFSIRCVFWSDPQFERIALLLQRQLADVGIDLVLQESDEMGIRQRAGSGDFDTFLYQLASGKSFDWTYRFWHSPVRGGLAYQDSGYTGVDSILERLRVVRPDAEVTAAVSDLRERFYQDVPAAFLAWPETTRAIDVRFDWGDRSDPDVFANLWKWHPRTEPLRAAR